MEPGTRSSRGKHRALRTLRACAVAGALLACVAAGTTTASAAPSASAPSGWTVGAQARGFTDFEPGNDWVLGFDAGYAPERWFGRRLEFRFAYLTSRPEAAFRNVLRQDWFLASPVWHFRPGRLIDPTLQLDLSWQRYDVENEAIFGDLENSTRVTGLLVGLQVNLPGRFHPLALRYAVGYQSAATESSVVYPLPVVFGIAWRLP